MKEVSGKTALITGAARGMGLALASHFVEDKAKVVLIDINGEALEKAAAQLRNTGGEVYPYVCDVTDRAKVYELADLVHKEVGTIAVLVNNAGVVFGGEFMDVADEHHQKTMDVNIMAYMWVTKAFLPDILEKKEGHLIYLASSAGLLGVNMLSSYCASKHAVIGFAESLRFELMKAGLKDIHITIVCPLYVNTGMFEGTKPPRMFGWLKTEEMCEKIYKAMKKNKPMLIVPGQARIAALSKILPPSLMYKIARILKVDTSMSDWTGRRDEYLR